MRNAKIYDVVCIGNYTKDTIVSPSGTQYVDGGAVRYAAFAVARMGLRTAVVTRLSREDIRVLEGFARAGIDCFATYSPTSTLMKLQYPTEDPDIRTLSVTSTAGSIRQDEVQDVPARAAVIGSSLRGEVGLDVIESLHQRGILLAADVQGFVRVLKGDQLNNEPWPEMPETLAYVDILKSDAVEAEFLTGERDVRKAAKAFAALGPREVVLTHKDGLLIFADGEYHRLEFTAKQLNGRSGRGDTCIGTYAAMRLSKTPFQAGTWAAAVTSLKMEKLGPFDRTVGEVEDLIKSKYNGSVRSSTAAD